MEYTEGEWRAWRFSKFHNWKVSMGDRNEFLDLGQDAEAQANANLIAAAPDMYQALKQAVRTFEAFRISPVDPRYRMLIDALIKVEVK